MLGPSISSLSQKIFLRGQMYLHPLTGLAYAAAFKNETSSPCWLTYDRLFAPSGGVQTPVDFCQVVPARLANVHIAFSAVVSFMGWSA
jgi:hypothetical protein